MAKFPLVGVSAVVEGVGSFLRDMGKMDSAVQGTANKADSAGSKIGSVGSKFASVGKAAAGAAVAGVAALGAAVVGIGVVSLKTAIEFESAWAGVVKTTDGLVDEFGNLTEAGEEMQTGFRDLAKEVPLAVEELLEIGELGGQLGVAGDDLLEFTDVIAAMGVSTNLTTDAAATGFAQLANVMGTTEQFGSSAFSRLGSSIVALGNTSATTEADILSFAQRMAGASKVAGVTEADMLGISASFTSVGIQAQAGGTAVSKTLLDMNKAVLDGGDQLEIYAATAGLTAEQFGTAWEQDAGAVFGEFVQGLGLAGDDAVAILDALEIKDSQAVRAFLSLAGAGDLVTESMETANKGWDENTALAAEAETRYKTTESQMILLKNTLKDVGITIGNILLPAFNQLLQAATPLISKLGKGLSSFFNNVLIPAVEMVGAAFSKLIAQIKGFGIGALFSNFEDGSSILSEFFENLGLSEGAAKKVTQAIQPIVKAIVEFAFVAKEAARDAVASFQKAIPKALAAAQKFITGSLLPAFQKLGQFILGQVVPAIVSFVQAVIAFAQQHGPAIRNAIIAIGAAFAAASIIGTIAGIVASIIALFNPITLIIGAIALLAFAWTENWFGIQEIVASAIAFMLPLFQSLVDFVTGTLIPGFIAFGELLVSVLTPIVQEFSAFIVASFAAVRDWVVENWPLIQETIQTVLAAIQGVVEGALSAVRTFWEENGAAIMAVVSAAWEGYKDFIEAEITVIAGIIEAIMQAINGDWEAAWATVQEALASAWDLIKDEVKAALDFIKDTIIPAALSAIEALFAAAWTGIQLAVETALAGIKIAINTGMKAARDILEFILDSIKDKVTAAWDAIPDLFKAGIEKAKGFVSSAAGAFKSAGGAIVDAIKEGINAAWSGLVDSLQENLNKLTDLLPGSKPKNPRSPLRKLPQAGASIVGNILQGLEAAMPALQAELGAALNPMQQSAPVTTIGGNTTTTTNVTQIDVLSQPASQPSEQAIYFDVSAALAAARGG